MDSQMQRLINDNPNLSNAVLGRFTGLTRKQVFTHRNATGTRPNWLHKGKGIPFVSRFIVDLSTIAWRVECKGRAITSSSNLRNVVDNVDRVIYCLENNDGKLPSKVLDNMKFIGRNL
ncbi:hypothetical protein VPHK24_0064 [Vibrio phage K24]|nr:hypothetical protein SIPHO078v2_p0052 [Vibrio phage 14E30.1]QZI92496.1 hypothetical protein SIPHO058v2_p0048 [Vibrio phage 14E30.2]